MCLKFCSSVCFFSLPKLPRKNFRQLELNAKQGKRKNGKEISAVGGENVSKAELPWENLRLCHNFFFLDEIAKMECFGFPRTYSISDNLHQDLNTKG